MRSQSWSDKQREAQQRKKQEELWKKSHPEQPEEPLTTETPKAETDTTDKAPKKINRKDRLERRSA
jgi:hypothetical protein